MAPAGRLSRKIGNVLAVCINATMIGLGAREVMSQAPETSCIHEPIFEKTAAIQRARKTGCRRGDHADVFEDWMSVTRFFSLQPFVSSWRIGSRPLF
jgi:hypothetical protein